MKTQEKIIIYQVFTPCSGMSGKSIFMFRSATPVTSLPPLSVYTPKTVPPDQ